MINAIFSNEITEEGVVSHKNKKGKNTTTNIRLYEIDDDSYIADTPGFASFEIDEIESQDLEKYFIEFSKYIDNCEFVGCTHIKEKKCGIKEALKEGKIDESRYQSFCYIYQDLKEKERRKW